MTIGIVTTWFERGAAYVSLQYMRALEKAGYTVRIYARGGEHQARTNPRWNGPNVTWAECPPQPWGWTAVDRRHFLSWLQREGISLVLFNEQQWWPAVLWAKDCNIPCAAYIDYYTEETVPFFAVYDRLFCNTRLHRQAFAWHPGCAYIPWGTDTEVFTPRDKPAEFADTTVFFHSAGMSPYRKGTDLLLAAYARTRGKALLFLHTQVDLREHLPSCAALLDDLQRQGRLRVFQGDVHAPGLYHNGDVYVYPARLDGLGLTQCEALACGLPIIVPDCGPMREFVAPGAGAAVPVTKLWARADGYYWPQCEVSVAALAATMQEYADDAERCAREQRAARAYALQERNWLRNAREVGSLAEQTTCTPVSGDTRRSIARFYREHANLSQAVYMKSPALWRMLHYVRSRMPQ